MRFHYSLTACGWQPRKRGGRMSRLQSDVSPHGRVTKVTRLRRFLLIKLTEVHVLLIR